MRFAPTAVRAGLLALGVAILVFWFAPNAMIHEAWSQTIIDDWSNVKAAPPPELKSVTLDPKSTALLLLDFSKQTCGPRPRCVATLPRVEKLATAARAKNVLVVHSLAGQATAADLLVAPQGAEQLVKSGANKFLRTDLEKTLKDKGITTVIVTGTAAIGLLIFTDNGLYSLQLMRSDRPKFASNNRVKGTPEENRAAVHGSIASFGTYTVDEANQTFTVRTVRYLGSTFPNRERTEETWPVVINGDELRMTHRSTSVGGPPSHSLYLRVK